MAGVEPAKARVGMSAAVEEREGGGGKFPNGWCVPVVRE